jgi:hypothetical protein
MLVSIPSTFDMVPPLYISLDNNMATRRTTYMSVSFLINRHDHVLSWVILMFYIVFACGKMKVAALFYLHEVVYVLANCSP